MQGAVNRYTVHGRPRGTLSGVGWEWFSALARQAQKFVLYDEDQVGMLKNGGRHRCSVTDSAVEYDWGTVGGNQSRASGLARADFAETDWVHA